jgi:hypothetical protein
MKPSCFFALIVAASTLYTGFAHADDATTVKPTRESIELVVSPAPEPSPALKYRLLPKYVDRKPGSAYPIYARLTAERGDRYKEHLNRAGDWLNRPLEDAASDECTQYLEGLTRVLESLELASRRERCDWDYPIGEGNAFLMLLPDVNESRMFWRVQALQVRHLVARNQLEEAIKALQVGFAMARHIEQAPFVVHDLVAIACAQLMLTQASELIQQPDAPNLYWAIASLPSPLVSSHEAVEVELNLLELSFPDTARLDELRSPDEWRNLLAQLQSTELESTRGHVVQDVREKMVSLVESHAKARRYFLKQKEYRAEQLDAMPLEELLVRWMLHPYPVVRDDLAKWSYLSSAKVEGFRNREQLSWRSDPDRSTFPENILHWLATDVLGATGPRARLYQRIAALQTIEVLRMHAAVNDGKLPASLNEVSLVPIPADPMAGSAFLYDLDDEGTAHLRSSHTSEYAADYRIRMRSGD